MQHVQKRIQAIRFIDKIYIFKKGTSVKRRCRGFCGGVFQGDGKPFGRSIFRMDRAAAGLNAGLDNGEPQAHAPAFAVPGGLRPVKGFEQSLNGPLGYTGTPVFDRNKHFIALLFCLFLFQFFIQDVPAANSATSGPLSPSSTTKTFANGPLDPPGPIDY